MNTTKDPNTGLVKDLLHAFDDLRGSQPGFRPTHAKGILLTGVFTPAAAAGELTIAPHIHRESTPVSVRFSDFGGIPQIPDHDPNAAPRGCAIRFHLAEHRHTDIISHSENGFPARTAEEFLEFLRAIYASAGAPHPTPVEVFLGSHPKALAFVMAPKPFPTSFSKDAYFGVSAYRFTNAAGKSQFGRYRIRSAEGPEYMGDVAAAKTAPDFLFDEMRARLAQGPVTLRITVQIADEGDVVDDSTQQWPDTRTEIDFGTLALSAVAPNVDAEQQRIIFDPIPRVDGIESSADPLLEPRADLYLASGRRRRSEGGQAAHGAA